MERKNAFREALGVVGFTAAFLITSPEGPYRGNLGIDRGGGAFSGTGAWTEAEIEAGGTKSQELLEVVPAAVSVPEAKTGRAAVRRRASTVTERRLMMILAFSVSETEEDGEK